MGRVEIGDRVIVEIPKNKGTGKGVKGKVIDITKRKFVIRSDAGTLSEVNKGLVRKLGKDEEKKKKEARKKKKPEKKLTFRERVKLEAKKEAERRKKRLAKRIGRKIGKASVFGIGERKKKKKKAKPKPKKEFDPFSGDSGLF